jgi:hypothetical protein
MPDALDEVITEITTLMAAMAGIDQAPEYPPEGVTPPMVVTYHVRCLPSYSLSYTHTIHTIHCDVLVSRAVLPHSEQQARPYILRGLSAIAGSVTLSTEATHCLLTEIIGPGVLPYQGESYFGVRYILEVKLTQKDLSLTVAA